MNKRALIITLTIVIAAVAGIYFYDKVFNKPKETLWDLVPENSGLVYEPQAGVVSWSFIHDSKIWNTLESFPSMKKLSEFVSKLDTLISVKELDQVISDGNLLLTLNPISGSEADFLFLYKLGKGRSTNHLNTMLKSVQDSFKVSTRIFNDFTIYEISDGKTPPFFSYSSSDIGWFGSFSPVLVEDVIRLLTTDKQQSFKNSNPEPFFTTRIRNDAGNFYFNFRQLSVLASTFLSPQAKKDSDAIGEFGKNAFFDLSVQDPLLLFNGFSYTSGKNQFLSNFIGKKPKSSIIEQYIPSRAAFCINTLYDIPKDSLKTDALIEEFRSSIDNEYAVVVLEATTIDDADKLYYLRSDDIPKSLGILNRYAASLKENTEDTLYFEDYSDYRIVELASKNFPQLFSEYTFGESDYYFFTSVNQYIVFSTHVEALKKFLVDIETENTWGRSVQKNKFLGSTLEESNFSIYVDLNKSWAYLLDVVHPEWKTHLESYSSEYKKFEFASLQFSNTDNKVYSNLIVYHNPDYVDIFARKRKLDPDIGVQLKANAITRPKVVRNHQTQAREIIIQNDSNEVNLISPDGKILWSKKLRGKVVSEIQQIDYFRNGYLQYIMAYDSAVTIIDRNGNEVSGFPRKLPFKVDKFNVIDYDNSKNYRFIFSDIHGNVFMYNKEGSLLEGWRPFFSNGTLAIEPRHIRVRGRDCIILFQKSGKFFLLSRRAEVLPGFPVDLGPDVNFDYALSYGSNFTNSEFTFVNKQGLIKRMNLEGEILNQQQFLSELRNPQFTIVSDVLGRGYIIVAREIGNIQFMNEKGETLFQQRLVGGLNYNFQYYNFGSTQKLYVITDPEQEYSYLFNSSGNLLNNSPIDSKFDIGVLYSESNNQYKIYSAYENKVNIYSF